MSSILSNNDVPSYAFNDFPSSNGFDILDIELPQSFDHQDSGNNHQLSSQRDQETTKQSPSFEIIHSSYNYDFNEDVENTEENSNQESSPKIFGKGKSMIEFFYLEEKEVIKLDSSIVIFDDYEIF